MEKPAQLEGTPPPLGGFAPAGSSGPQAALRPRFALPPGIPQGLAAPRPSASPQIEAPEGGRMAPTSPPLGRLIGDRGAPRPPGLEEGAGHGLSAEQAHQVRHPLPSPPPLPAGKGSESPSVVKGAGRAALRLLLLPP